MFKLKWKITLVIFLVALLSTSIIGFSSWRAYKESITLETLNSLNYYVKDQWTLYNRELLDVTDGRKIINDYIELTFDLNKAQMAPEYMDAYLNDLKLVVQIMAQHQSYHSAYVYFDPKIFGDVYGIWYADFNQDGIVEEQPQIPLAYFDPSLADREWFYKPLNENTTSWTSPYFGQLNYTSKTHFVSLTGPAIVKDKAVAVVGVDYFLDQVLEDMKKSYDDKTRYAFLLDSNYRILSHPIYPPGTSFSDLPDQHGEKVLTEFKQSDYGHFPYQLDNSDDSILSFRKLDNGWIFANVIYTKNVFQSLYNTRKLILFLIGAAVSASVLLSLYFGKIVSKPLEQLAEAINQIGKGVYETKIEQKLILNNNELGLLANAVDKMREQILADFEDANESHQMLEDMNKELLLRNEKLQALSEAKGQFLANMSHEIRTPLNGIMGSLQLLEMSQTETQKELIGISKSATEALMDVLNSILDYSKIESNHLELERSAFSVFEVMRQTMELFKHAALIKDLQLQMDMDHLVPEFATGDAFRLKQILSNLMGNAVKYTHQGSVQLSVRRIESQSMDELRLEFSVKDTGIGVPKDKYEVLFNSFSQADISDTRRYGGTGLGLSICKGLVEKMGGTISVESEVGVGSVFRFNCILGCFDCHQAEQPNKNESTFLSHSGGLQSIKILVAEDDAVSGLIMKKYAEAMDWEISIANNGVEAVTLMNTATFDIVFMDIQMPIMDGLEAVKQIRNTLGKKTIPIIAVAAHLDIGVSNKYKDAGMNDYLVKPIKMSDFQDMVHKWLYETDQRNP